MRLLKFEGDNIDHHEVFQFLMGAWFFVTGPDRMPLVQVGNTPERIELAVDTTRALRNASVAVGPGDYDLRPEGAELEMRDTQLELLKEFWVARRKLLPPAAAEIMQKVDAYLKDVPVVEPAAAKPKLNAKAGRS